MKDLKKRTLIVVRASTLELILGLVCQNYGLEVACSAAREWVFPKFTDPDAQKVYLLNWLNPFLDNRNCVVELRSITRKLNLPNPVFRWLPTQRENSNRGKWKQSIMMRYAAIHRYGVFINDIKIEDGMKSEIYVFMF